MQTGHLRFSSSFDNYFLPPSLLTNSPLLLKPLYFALWLAGALAFSLDSSSALAQTPATTPFPSWMSALQRAANGGENAQIAFIGDSNVDAPRGFYLPLRLTFEAQAAGSAGSAPGGAGVTALTGFLINDLKVHQTAGAWVSQIDTRGLADPTLVSMSAGDTLSVRGVAAPSLFERATVHFDKVPGGGRASVEFRDTTNALLHSATIDLDGLAGGASVTVRYDGFVFQAGNRVVIRTLDPRTAGVRLLAVVTDRRPNNSVQVHKLAYGGFNAQEWSARLRNTAMTAFWNSQDLAIVSLGTNDMRRGDSRAYAQFEAGMTDILTFFRTAGVPVIVAAPADMAPVIRNNGSPRDFDETSMRITLKRLCATYGAAYYDLGTLHGDHTQILRDGIYRPNDPVHFQTFNLTDPASLRHGPFFFNAVMGLPTADRSAGNTPAPTPAAIATPSRCGWIVVREVDGSGTPAYITFRAPAPNDSVLAQVRNDVRLGEVRLETYQEFNDASRTSTDGLRYGPRQLTFRPEIDAPVTFRLPVTPSEVAALGLAQAADVRWMRDNLAPGAACLGYDDVGGLRSDNAAVLPIGGGHLLEFTAQSASSFYQVAALVNPMPVELLSFTAAAMPSGTLLAWETATEEGFSHFTVERSGDGGRWTPLAQVLAKASTSEKATGAQNKRYSYEDNSTAAAGLAVAYYRLTLHDNDGSLAYSETVVADRSMRQDVRAEAVLIWPNPATATVTISVPRESVGQRLVVRDVLGRVVYEQTIDAPAVEVDVRGLSAGQYVVEAEGVARLARLVVW